MLAAAGTDGLEVDALVTATPGPQALIDRSWDSELLVVGSRGHGGFRGLVLGSVSMQCVLHAHCPVTVVRAEPAPAAEAAHAGGGPAADDRALLLTGIAEGSTELPRTVRGGSVAFGRCHASCCGPRAVAATEWVETKVPVGTRRYGAGSGQREGGTQ